MSAEKVLHTYIAVVCISEALQWGENRRESSSPAAPRHLAHRLQERQLTAETITAYRREKKEPLRFRSVIGKRSGIAYVLLQKRTYLTVSFTVSAPAFTIYMPLPSERDASPEPLATAIPAGV